MAMRLPFSHILAVVLGFSVVTVLLFGVPTAVRAAGGTESVETAAKDAQASVEKTSSKIAADFEEMWHRISDTRLRNRTPDQIVAWVIVGLLVGSLAGGLTGLKPTGFGQVGRLVFGLCGAFLGGVAANLTRVDFGWGPVLIRYEDLFFSFAGAVLIVILFRLIRRASKKSKS
jgi:uncharacterized membrane protein YeaQ/YmgE (transglycosylase-associated protein family)